MLNINEVTEIFYFTDQFSKEFNSILFDGSCSCLSWFRRGSHFAKDIGKSKLLSGKSVIFLIFTHFLVDL